MRLFEYPLVFRCELTKLYYRLIYGRQFHFGKRLYFRRRFVLHLSRSEARVSIGDNCFFNNNCSINSRSGVSIGNRCTFGESVLIYDHDHNFRNVDSDDSGYVTGCIEIGDDCWFGSNVTILKGVTIGNGVVVGAGTIVTKNIPSDSIVYGKTELVVRPK